MDSLFDGMDDAPPPRPRTIQARFEAWLARHPDVYHLFKQFAYELLRAGRQRYGSKGLAERLRWHYATSSQGEDFKINNVFTSRLARKLMDECPEFRGFFETRRLKSP